MSKHEISRREFIGRTAAGAAAAGLGLGAPAIGRLASPNEKVTVAVIGAGIRGLELMRSILAVGGNVAMVCDLYDGHFRRAQEIQPNTPTTREHRDILDRKDIDAVFIATSDHWHAPIAIDALRAGKDVYCEKPMTHTIPQAVQMTDVAKETNRLVQVGSQSLSMTSTRKAKELVESGQVGNVYMIEASLFRPNAIGAWRYPVPPDASPETIDWERFLGNATPRPFDAQRFFQFRNWWDYGTGIAGDECVHLLSRVHYVLGVQFPRTAMAAGGIYKWTGDREVPDVHNTLYDYGKFQAVVMANLACNWDTEEIVRFFGDKGTVELREMSANFVPYNPVEDYLYPLESWPKDTKEKFLAEHKDDPLADIGTARQQPQRPKESFPQKEEGTEDHIRNFFECVKSRRQPIENVEFGLGTAVACHMANISYIKKKQVIWDADKRVARLEG
jgi:predicted dehydrogenase